VTRVDSLLERMLGLERPLLLAFDVDGTLSPIVRDPDLARIPEETLRTIAELAESPMTEVALITGRDLSSLGRMEQLNGIWRAVEHGGLVLAPGARPAPRELMAEHEAALDRFRHWVDAHAEGAFIEYKPQAIAVHVRAIAETDPERAERLLREADEQARDLGLHVRRGKALREAEAVPQDKGEALRKIFERSGAKSVFFAGDDITDFPAIDFATQHGVGAFVCSDEQRGTPTKEAEFLGSVSELAELLSRLLEKIRS
jgi:trehalose-phosphatase